MNFTVYNFPGDASQDISLHPHYNYLNVKSLLTLFMTKMLTGNLTINFYQ